MSELTPLMKQYFSIKEKYKDAIVFFRLGDFYEMFGEDAEKASKVLQIALTTRDKSKEEPIPMCGIPYFASESYISKLIKAGYKVAICEQMEDPKEARGLVQRDIVRVITPGTHASENPKENTYIISLFPSAHKHGIAVADVSTGEFVVYETDKDVEDEMYRFEPREILLPQCLKDNIHYKEALNNFYITFYEDWYFDYPEAYKTLLRHLKVSSLDGYGCDNMFSAIPAAGALVSYLEDTQKETFTLKKITTLRQDSYMFLDAVTKRNLELTHNLKDGSSKGTLLWVLDETLTPMGGRFLRGAILKPLIDIQEIKERQNAVEYLVEDYELLEEIRTSLRKIQDLERLSSRASSGITNARDLIAIKNSLVHLPKIKKPLGSSKNPYLRSISEEITEFSALRDLIERGIIDNPPIFQEMLGQIQKETALLSKTAFALSITDFIASLAVVAKRYNYVKPTVDESGIIDITDGRHPVLERIPMEERFIPNSTYMDTEDNRLLIITGPNMAGKSTYMRQISLIILMAQIGSFIPASSARTGITDRIFTRIGASDFLTRGQSTFMVEMIEVANIVHNATGKSLILLDEVGRGTSTFDGISIAWAVTEHILNGICARTLFATHYNELTEISLTHDSVRNYNVSVKEWGDEIIFLRRIEKGPADKSYGIQVARLAGIPDHIINRAKEVLANLEKEELNEAGIPRFVNGKIKKGAVQLDLFSSIHESIITEIINLDVNRLKSEDALNKLIDIKKKIDSYHITSLTKKKNL